MTGARRPCASCGAPLEPGDRFCGSCGQDTAASAHAADATRAVQAWGTGPGQQPSPPGWYPDYADPSRQRWFDGTGWTEHVHPPVHAPGAPWPPAAVAPRTGGGGSGGWVVAGLLALAAGGLILGSVWLSAIRLDSGFGKVENSLWDLRDVPDGGEDLYVWALVAAAVGVMGGVLCLVGTAVRTPAARAFFAVVPLVAAGLAAYVALRVVTEKRDLDDLVQEGELVLGFGFYAQAAAAVLFLAAAIIGFASLRSGIRGTGPGAA